VQKDVMSHVTNFFLFYQATKQVISICCSSSKGGSSTILTLPTCTLSPKKKELEMVFGAKVLWLNHLPEFLQQAMV